MKKIFVYGSLRSGMYNNERMFGSNREPKEVINISGYEMYSLDYYPAIIRGDGIIVTELLDVTLDEFARIDFMERSAGYIKIYVEEYDAYMWIYQRSIRDLEKVESGDWVKFKEGEK